jgi:hypothetical protein
MKTHTRSTIHLTWVVAWSVSAVLGAQQTPSAVPSVAVTGYVTSTFTSSTNARNDTIVGRLYGRRQNEFMLNVANVTIERQPATDKWQAGFHTEAWFGQNAPVVKSTGLDIGPNADIWQAYAVLNMPMTGASRYFQIKAGKMATLMGVEVGEDVLNPNLDVASQDIFLEPFTETGVELDGKFGPRIDAELRITNGWDQVTDVNHSKSFVARIGLTPDEKTSLSALGYVGPEQANNTSNQRLGGELLVSRKLAAPSMAWLQADYGQDAGAASDGGQAKWYGAGAWLTYDIASTSTLALRGDYMNDRDGARTSGLLGYPVNTGQRVASATATLNIKRWPQALVRPEIRYDHSSLSVFNTNASQLTFSTGLSYIF